MADVQLSRAVDAFLLRCGLNPQDQLHCNDFIRQIYPGKCVSLSPCQGFCSMTVFVGNDIVVQFRPRIYCLDLQVTKAAQNVYGRLAPSTSFLGIVPWCGLLAYSMKRIHGISYMDFQSISLAVQDLMVHRARLCKDFAMFTAKSWSSSSANYLPLGRIGNSIRPRLVLLRKELPARFRPVAQNILDNLAEIEKLPWVFTHGDITRGNLIVDPETGSLTGFVDWAEAEILPFGLSLYGFEELLGQMTSIGFQYHSDAEELRSLFWTELADLIPLLRQAQYLRAVQLARDLGVLLWHGIAFDDGKIDRVVQEDRDVDEIFRLDAFLNVGDARILNGVSKD